MPDFQQQQLALTAAIRGLAPLAGVAAPRLALYRRLFYDNIEALLAKAFPVLRAISDDAVWHARVRDFFARHRCRAPEFHRVAEEFLRYLDEERDPAHAEDPPFLRELCHYEWVELALAVAPIEAIAPPATAIDLDSALQLSPLAWPLAYTWPVQRIGPAFQPARPPAQPTYLLVYRDGAGAVRFLELAAGSARLLQLMEQQPRQPARVLLEGLSAELPQADRRALLAQAAAWLDDLAQRGIVWSPA